MYPVPTDHDPEFDVIDGRHRWCAAVMRGAPTELRCDVISSSGHALRLIPTSKIQIAADVQVDFAYNERWARTISNKWNDRYVGVLTVIPINDGGLSVSERARIKTAIDRDRRGVRHIESFLLRVKQGEPEATEIDRVVTDAGFEIGKLSSSKPYTRFECVVGIERIYAQLGAQGLARTLYLCTMWKDEPKTNTRFWLDALSLLVRDGYDEALTPSGIAALKEVVPAVAIRRAQGEALSLSGGTTHAASAVAVAVATALRKKARMKIRPTQSVNPRTRGL